MNKLFERDLVLVGCFLVWTFVFVYFISDVLVGFVLVFLVWCGYFVLDRYLNIDRVSFTDRFFALVCIPLVWNNAELKGELWILFRYGDVGNVLARKLGKKG